MRATLLILLISYSFYSGIEEGAGHESKPLVLNHFVDPDIMIQEGQALLKEGDLVARLNQDPMSFFIKNFNRHDKSYSHAGIVLYEDGYPYVYHIVNGNENPGEKLRKDSLSRFCNPGRNTAYGIFRYNMSTDEIKRIKNLIHKWYAKGVQFDPKFNLKTNDKMYCSEMISKALVLATNKRILTGTTKLTDTEAKLFSVHGHLPYAYTSKLRVVAIDNLYTNSFCHLIREYNYEINR